MTDLEITKLCAEAMGVDFSKGFGTITCKECGEIGIPYDPLHDDAQAMALVKKFNLQIQSPAIDGEHWHCWKFKAPNHTGLSKDLNHAICECVAKMGKAKP